MLHNLTRMLPCLRLCVSQQFCNKPLLCNHLCSTICTLTTSDHFNFSMVKHQLVICHRSNSDDSTSDSRIDSSGLNEESIKDTSSDLIDFNEMLDNMRKLKTEEDGDIKSVYTGKKKYRVSDEERRTQPMTIEELVEFLTMLNGIDICVIRVDPSLNYVTYLVTVTGVSTRHLLSMAKSLVYEVKCEIVGYIIIMYIWLLSI